MTKFDPAILKQWQLWPSETMRYEVVIVKRSACPRIDGYENLWWFRDYGKLLRDTHFHFHRCKHSPELPKNWQKLDQDELEGIDFYFLDQMKLENEGWISFSIGEYSRNEYRRIKKWLDDRRDLTYYMEEHPDADVYPFIGPCEFTCWSATVHPSLADEFEDYLRSFHNLRPCVAYTPKLTKEIKELLPSNTFMRHGPHGTVMRFALTKNYQKIVDLCQA